MCVADTASISLRVTTIEGPANATSTEVYPVLRKSLRVDTGCFVVPAAVDGLFRLTAVRRSARWLRYWLQGPGCLIPSLVTGVFIPHTHSHTHALTLSALHPTRRVLRLCRLPHRPLFLPFVCADCILTATGGHGRCRSCVRGRVCELHFGHGVCVCFGRHLVQSYCLNSGPCQCLA